MAHLIPSDLTEAMLSDPARAELETLSILMVRIRLSDSSSAEFNPPVGSTTSGVVAAQEAARGVLSDLQGTFKKSAKSRGHLGG